jgi:hypothetical protein
MQSPYCPSPGRWPRDKKAITQRPVTAGSAPACVGKEPSSSCFDARNASALSTRRSSTFRCSGGNFSRSSRAADCSEWPLSVFGTPPGGSAPRVADRLIEVRTSSKASRRKPSPSPIACVVRGMKRQSGFGRPSNVMQKNGVQEAVYARRPPIQLSRHVIARFIGLAYSARRLSGTGKPHPCGFSGPRGSSRTGRPRRACQAAGFQVAAVARQGGTTR